jgi:hypothetical protein
MGGRRAHSAQMVDRTEPDLDEAAAAIIRRRRPDLAGKSLQEIKAVLRGQKPQGRRPRGRNKKRVAVPNPL